MQFLYDYHSPGKCLNASLRHMRLSRQIPGGAKYEQAITAVHAELNSKNDALKAANDEVAASHDTVNLGDTLLDALLKKINHNCEDYDNEHTGSFTRTTLFPNGNYSEITGMNKYKEPGKALEIAEKIISFGETHSLYPFAAQIKTQVAASEKTIKDEGDAIKAAALAKANMEIAKLALIRKYNSNYYQAADEGGKAFAESLFPDLRGNNDKNDDGEGPDSGTK
jgi:hypothetical protein